MCGCRVTKQWDFLVMNWLNKLLRINFLNDGENMLQSLCWLYKLRYTYVDRCMDLKPEPKTKIGTLSTKKKKPASLWHHKERCCLVNLQNLWIQPYSAKNTQLWIDRRHYSGNNGRSTFRVHSSHHVFQHKVL